MNCPACAQPLSAGRERCPSCGRMVAPPVEGSLAPDPLANPESVEPLREVPGLRKRELTWKDEVRDRVRRRRSQRGAPALARDVTETRRPESLLLMEEAEEPGADPDVAEAPFAITEKMDHPEVSSTAEDLEDPLTDSPIAGAIPVAEEPPSGEWDIQPVLQEPEPSPVERPAHLVERAQAAAIDISLMAGLWALVVYFASRVARVPVEGLLGAWFPLGSYLLLLGLVYAAYFTGISGQTLGKTMSRLKVVDRAGRPPTILNASMRAVVGTLGVVLASAGIVPMLFDPARRAFHDRLLGTRVIRL